MSTNRKCPSGCLMPKYYNKNLKSQVPNTEKKVGKVTNSV